LDVYIAEADAAPKGDDGKPLEEIAPFPDFDHPDQEAVRILESKLASSSQLLREMAVENAKFERNFPRIAVAHCLSGGERLPMELRYEAGVISIESIVELQAALETEYGRDKGALVFAQLSVAVTNRFYLTKATEKNSASPAASPLSQSDTKMGQAKVDGISPDLAPLKETQEGSSTDNVTS